MSLDALRRVYTQTAVILLNTVVLLLIVNALAGVATWIRHRGAGEPETVARMLAEYGTARLLQAYPGRSEGEVLALLHETWDSAGGEGVYEELTQFREAPLRGRYVNIDSAGFRVSTPQGPWPPDPANFNVFMLGGSTTFGYGVSDGETLASAIQALIPRVAARPVFVYNFGRGSYFSTQEMVLYYRLLTSGRIPNVAVFVDGLNDFSNPTGALDHTANLESLVEQYGWESSRGSLRGFILHTQTAQATRWLLRTLKLDRKAEPLAARFDAPVLERGRDRWLTNKQVIEKLSAMYGVRPLFVWQPIPTYHYDYQQYHVLRGLGFERQPWHVAPRLGYAVMERSRAALDAGNDFLWLADMQDDERENLYVDETHYTARFMREIAADICQALREHGYVADR